MKKLILSAFGMATLLASANAQIFSENFDTEIPATWTIIDVDGLTASTGQSDYASWAHNSDVNAAASTSWYDNNGTGPTDDWLITPGIAVPASGSYILEFLGASYEASFLEEYEVYYSTTGTTVADFPIANRLADITDEPSAFTPHGIALPAATAGQTTYIAFRHISDDESMLLIDNVVVRELLDDDAEITSLDIESYVAAGNVDIKGVITNQGANTITAMDIVWNDGSGAQTQNLTGLSIALGQTYSFTHSTTLSAVAGTSYNLDVYVVAPSDLNATNDTLKTSVVALSTIPAKIVVGEEKTGSWCGYCPRGGVGLASMESNSKFIGIAVHNADPMTISNYDSGTATYHPDFTGYPHGAVDRVIGGDPSSSSFNTMNTERASAIVPCEVKNIVASINNTTGKISVSADAEFYGNLTGDYRMSCVIIEDDVIGTGAGWSQTNYYDSGNGPLVDPVSNFNWVGAGDPVAPIDFGGYDHVARSLSNDDILGDAGSLTANPTIGVQSYSFADVNSSVIIDGRKAHAVVMIIDASTGEILNAGKSSILAAVSVEDIDAAEFNLSAFPNPTNNVSTISFNLDQSTVVSTEVLNSVGSVVYAEESRNMAAGTQKITFDGTELPAGIYFVNLKFGEQIITKKVSLVK